MNFKSIGFSAVLSAAAISGATLASAPAQAFDLYSKTLSFTGKAALYATESTADPSNYFTLDFFAQPGGTGTPLVGQTPGGSATLQGSDTVFGQEDRKVNLVDLILSKDTATTWSLVGTPVVDFITGLDNSIKFTLTAFNLAKDSGGGFSAGIEGFFTAPPKFPGVAIIPGNNFTSQSSLSKVLFSGTNLVENKSGATYSADLTTIPTPALLPGLIGLGVAALRKRKAVATEKASAEV